MARKVLIAGESWMSYTTHVKGFDSFYTAAYEEGVGFLREALQKAGYEVEHLPNHLANTKFPYTMAEIGQYSCVILSDIGSNTLLLPPQTFTKSMENPNRCDLIKQYVLEGGAFLMIGGYMSFTGIDAKTRYGQTAVKDVLPVKCLEFDDRAEHPEGAAPEVQKEHPIVDGLPRQWPNLLGYNKTQAIDGYDVIVTISGDPLISAGDFGKGRSAVFTSDCAPHWAPPPFVNWEHYNLLWKNILDYITRS